MNNFDEKMKKEKEFLDSVAPTYVQDSQYNAWKRELLIGAFAPFMSIGRTGIPAGRCLQLGCHNGVETILISKLVGQLDVIDGAQAFIDECLKLNLPNTKFIRTLFEEYSVASEEMKYDYVFANYVLEHVINVETVLKMISAVIKPDGLLFVTVPNARALSRQLAFQMNLIPGLMKFTENDIKHGHRRIFDRFALNKEIEAGGFEIISQGGIIFKILADFQMDRLLSDGILTKEHIVGLHKIGQSYPDLCDAIYCVNKLGVDHAGESVASSD
jgi:2-polyprenyl-3-methyl-5-hydroxy-6-metoxy-1,4-benzoquinol methylase